MYSVHEETVHCISKGNPYDGHTLEGALENAQALSGTTPKHVYCDKCYKGHKQNGKGLSSTSNTVQDKPKIHLDGPIPKTATRAEKAWRKRRAAIEPTIGHLKSDNRMARNFLRGAIGNEINPVLAAAAYNLRKLLAWFFALNWMGLKPIISKILGNIFAPRVKIAILHL